MIKRYVNFINEKLGVPEGNIESAIELYNFIIENIMDHDIEVDSQDKLIIDIEFNNDLKISDFKFNIDLYIYINQFEQFKNIELISMNVQHLSKVKNNKIVYDVSSEPTIMEIHFASSDLRSQDFILKEIFEYLKNNKAKIIGSLAHELKHIYDRHMIKHRILSDQVEYESYNEFKIGVPSIDLFTYNLYYITKVESLVRSSELAAELVSSNITRDEFKSYLEESRIFKIIKEVSKFTYESLRDSLLNDTNEIKSLLTRNKIEIPKTDEELIDFMLELTYINLVNLKVDKMANLLAKNDPIRFLLIGELRDEDLKFLMKYHKSKVFDNHKEFYKYYESIFKSESDKIIRKLSKLYAICKPNP